MQYHGITLTKHCWDPIYSTGKSRGGSIKFSNTIGQRLIIGLWLCYASVTTLLIYTRNQTSTFRLNGSLTKEMLNKKVEMAFDALQVKAVEGLIRFTNPMGHRSTGASSTWRGLEREIWESEMNNFKRHQQPHLTKVAFYSSSNLKIFHKLLWMKKPLSWGETTWGETTSFWCPEPIL